MYPLIFIKKMFDRTITLIGKEKYQKLQKSNILVLGLGGVGGYIVESLIRSGIENITLVDFDKIDITNINRQIIATKENIGNNKTEEWKKRIQSINQNVKINIINQKITSENINILFNEDYNFIVDACDTVIVKKLLIKECKKRNINLITVCGMGKKLNPSLVKICDIRETSYDPLAKSLRKYVKEENIKGKIPCIFSEEKPITNNNSIVSSMIMVPSIAGILAAHYCIDKIINN